MKSITNVKIATKEGIEIKNLQRFPSLEWGPMGGLQAEVYLNGKSIGVLYQAGNGGCANFTYNNSEDYTELAKAALLFLKRVDKDYGPNSQYEWLKNKKSYRDIGDDDIEAVVSAIEERYDDLVAVQKIFKKGCKSAIILKSDLETRYLEGNIAEITIEHIEQYLTKNNMSGKYSEISIIKNQNELMIL